MLFEVQKTENCFADSHTFEYRLPLDGQCFSALLSGWEVSENYKYRRPLFIADRNGINIKGILKANTIKVSFQENGWEDRKNDFEHWLEDLNI